jgi:hypothetical protein
MFLIKKSHPNRDFCSTDFVPKCLAIYCLLHKGLPLGLRMRKKKCYVLASFGLLLRTLALSRTSLAAPGARLGCRRRCYK